MERVPPVILERGEEQLQEVVASRSSRIYMYVSRNADNK